MQPDSGYQLRICQSSTSAAFPGKINWHPGIKVRENTLILQTVVVVNNKRIDICRGDLPGREVSTGQPTTINA